MLDHCTRCCPTNVDVPLWLSIPLLVLGVCVISFAFWVMGKCCWEAWKDQRGR